MSKGAVIQLSGIVIVAAAAFAVVLHFSLLDATSAQAPEQVIVEVQEEPVRTLDTAAYDTKLLQLAHRDPVALSESATESVTDDVTEIQTEPLPTPLWPAEAVYPNVDALLPFNRIVAYYGNFYSKGMGILGEYTQEEVLRQLRNEVVNWEAADPSTPVIPAIDYIAVTAQAGPGNDGMYRKRMPDDQIQKAIDMAAEVEGIVILEIQAGLADLLTEVKQLEPYLSLPQVHLAIDPEFAMVKSGRRPGTVVGTVDAIQVNVIAEYLASLVKEYELTPKVLVVHRYTQAMVTNAADITPLPEVQIVMDMDGWGSPGAKFNTYQQYIYSEPVQFTGFKVFYPKTWRQSDLRLLTPTEILELTPQPSFIQYQ